MILIACEESQAVCKAFRKEGFEAYSNDIEDCSGGRPEWHIKGDAIEVMHSRKWLAVIAFPPCTHLCSSGARHWEEKRKDGRQQNAINFFMHFANYSGLYSIENPIGIMSKAFRKPDQIIQPWQFGHPESKKTCLWINGLPLLKPTNILPLPKCGHWQNQTHKGQNKLIVDGKWIGWNDPRTAQHRSKTYSGIAEAMATQWGAFLRALPA